MDDAGIVGPGDGDGSGAIDIEVESGSPYVAAILGVLASVPDAGHHMAAVMQAEKARIGSAETKQPGPGEEADRFA